MLAQYLVHVGYTLQLLALLARDVLWLRGILVAAQSVLAFYAFTRGLWPYVFWNLLFVAINCWWVARLLRERRAVRLPPELKDVHERNFAALTPPEFLRLWREGRHGTARDLRLVREGTKPDALFFVRSGEVEIEHAGRVVARVGPGGFVAEMSLLTGEPTSADAWARDTVEYVSWPVASLERLRRDNPVFWTRLQSVLGHDLVEKLRRSAAPA